MPISLEGLKKETKKLAPIMVGEEDLNIVFRPNAFTPELESTLGAAEGSLTESIVAMIESLIVSWDFQDAKKKDLPVTPEVINVVPTRLLLLIVQKIGEDLRPPLEQTKGSFG